MTIVGQSGAQNLSSRRVKRTRRRVAGGRRPFVPYGLVPALALLATVLYAIVPFATGIIQKSALDTARSALVDSGESWARADASGQWITLSGTPPSGQAAQAAIQAVTQAQSKPTLFGRLPPVTRVINNFASPAPVAASPPLVSDLQTQATIPIRVQEWIYRLEDGALRLNGDVPDDRTQTIILEAARAAIDPPRISSVIDGLVVTGSPAQRGYEDIALKGIGTLSQCERGEAKFENAAFSLFCEASENTASRIEEMAKLDLLAENRGEIQVLAREAVANCDRTLSTLLNETRIEFASGSDRISNTSTPVIERIANAALDCPGRLRIEGHTDNTGRADFNSQLSQGRAEAVRNALIERGIEADRLIAQGFGSSRPIATNSNQAGRARNRRIEIKVVRTPQ